MEKSKQVKKLESNIKSSYGTFVVFPILTLIYVIRCFIAGDLNYYFASFFSEFLLKHTGYFEGYKEGLSLPLALAIIVVYNALFALCYVLSCKNFKWTYFGFALFVFDFALEIFCIVTNYFEPFHVDMLVDVIVHAFIAFFLILGMVSYKKLEKIGSEKLTQNV
ncbi:MAG: hypothetical protein R3Y27_06105 [Clostridia bacterium]